MVRFYKIKTSKYSLNSFVKSAKLIPTTILKATTLQRFWRMSVIFLGLGHPVPLTCLVGAISPWISCISAYLVSEALPPFFWIIFSRMFIQ